MKSFIGSLHLGMGGDWTLAIGLGRLSVHAYSTCDSVCKASRTLWHLVHCVGSDQTLSSDHSSVQNRWQYQSQTAVIVYYSPQIKSVLL